MDITIPKSSHRHLYQLSLTPEIRQLQTTFNLLQQNAEVNDWTRNNYNEYISVRRELREKCKKAHNKTWEDNITKIIYLSKDSKLFWRKIKLLKGKKYNTYKLNERCGWE